MFKLMQASKVLAETKELADESRSQVQEGKQSKLIKSNRV